MGDSEQVEISDVNPIVAEFRRQYGTLTAQFDELDALAAKGQRYQAAWRLLSLANELGALRDAIEGLYAIAYKLQGVLEAWDPVGMASLGALFPSTRLLEQGDVNDRIDEVDMVALAWGLERGEQPAEILASRLSGEGYPTWHHSTIPDSLPCEIEYMLDMLEILVEASFEPVASRNEEDGSEDGASSRHIPARVKAAVWRRDSGRCVECESKDRLEYDHIIPHSRGGSNTERNIQLLCERCNRKKGAELF